MHIASVSSLFAHQVIWNMMANMYIDDAGSVPDPMKPTLQANGLQNCFPISRLRSTILRT